MKGITVLSAFLFLFIITPLTAQLDNTFADNGTLVNSSGLSNNPYTESKTRSIALQPDGKIVGLTYNQAYLPSVESAAVKLFRLLPDGTYDTTFGDMGFSDVPDLGRGSKVLLQDDGKILVAIGTSFAVSSPAVSVVRFNADGSLDASFAANGIASTGGVTIDPILLLQNDQKILFGVRDMLYRFDTNGSSDNSFDADGVLDIGADIEDVVVLSDGKLLVNTASVTYRYTASGSLDNSFGSNGSIAQTGIMKVSPVDGAIVFGLTSTDNQFLEVIKYTNNGVLDTGFGNNGTVSLALPAATYPDVIWSSERILEDMLIQSTGEIIIIGVYTDNNYSSETLYEERYRLRADGVEDADFDTTPKMIVEDESSSNDVFLKMQLLANDDFLIHTNGYYFFGNGRLHGLSHFSADGTQYMFDTGLLGDICISDIVQQADNKIVIAGGNFDFDDLGENNVEATVPLVRRYCPQAYFGESGCADLLPLELIYFKGYTTTRNTNVLQWQTTTETNTNKIILERSADADKWETLKTLQAQGNSNVVTNYEAEDANPFLETYYRLKMIDADGSTYFSDVISLKRHKQNGISVYPNPAENNINLQFTATKTTSIRISNIIGSVLYEVSSTSDTGLHSQTFDISKFPKGLYFMTIDDGESKQTKRFVKQ